ncbi:MAG: hypothetical protein WCT18_02030 [Patescibacteria group bacterium]
MKRPVVILFFIILLIFSCSESEVEHQRETYSVPVIYSGEIFELTLYNGLADNPGLVFRDYDHGGVHTRFGGKQINACEIGQHQFQLVEVGDQENMEAVVKELEQFGKIPCGQWIEAFRFRFPLSDGLGNIGVADPSWITTVWAGDATSYPMLTNYSGQDKPWKPTWFWKHEKVSKGFRWLVQVD